MYAVDMWTALSAPADSMTIFETSFIYFSFYRNGKSEYILNETKSQFSKP